MVPRGTQFVLIKREKVVTERKSTRRSGQQWKQRAELGGTEQGSPKHSHAVLCKEEKAKFVFICKLVGLQVFQIHLVLHFNLETTNNRPAITGRAAEKHFKANSSQAC